MTVILKIFVIVLIFGIFLLAAAMVKNNNTYKNQMIILTAIGDYRKYMISLRKWDFFEVSYSDMESYNDTFKRWWDWGYSRILPPEKFEIIKPYIKGENDA